MAERHNLTVDECLALLKDASLRPESIAEEVECAGVSRPQPTQVQSARDVLAKLHPEAVAQTAGLAGPDARALAAEIASLPEMLALALVHAAGRVARQEVLLELATSPSRMLAKESKRELQKLKQRGVQVQEIPPQGEPVLKPLPEGEAPSCYASSIDAYGERAVWWTRAARQGVEVVQVVLSDVKGILAVDALALSRRSWRGVVKRVPRQGVGASAGVPRGDARQPIAGAEAAGGGHRLPPPAGVRRGAADPRPCAGQPAAFARARRRDAGRAGASDGRRGALRGSVVHDLDPGGRRPAPVRVAGGRDRHQPAVHRRPAAPAGVRARVGRCGGRVLHSPTSRAVLAAAGGDGAHSRLRAGR